MKTSGVIYAMLFGTLLAAAPNQAQAKNEKAISLTPIGRYSAGPSTSQPVLPRAEIAAYDPATNRLFAINADQSRIDVLDISAPHLPTPLAPIPLGSGLLANSIAIHDGIVAVALQADPKTNPGVVKFFDTDGALLNQVTVGAPSAVTQNRPLRVTSKPANGSSVRGIDSDAKPFRLARHEQCLERRKATTNFGPWAPRLVTAAHRAKHRCAP